MGNLTDIRRVYDTVANTYADYFPTTEPEQPIEDQAVLMARRAR